MNQRADSLSSVFRVRFYCEGERNFSFETHYVTAGTKEGAVSILKETLAQLGRKISVVKSVDLWG